jgi:hypothetical protein
MWVGVDSGSGASESGLGEIQIWPLSAEAVAPVHIKRHVRAHHMLVHNDFVIVAENRNAEEYDVNEVIDHEDVRGARLRKYRWATPRAPSFVSADVGIADQQAELRWPAVLDDLAVVGDELFALDVGGRKNQLRTFDSLSLAGTGPLILTDPSKASHAQFALDLQMRSACSIAAMDNQLIVLLGMPYSILLFFDAQQRTLVRRIFDDQFMPYSPLHRTQEDLMWIAVCGGSIFVVQGHEADTMRRRSPKHQRSMVYMLTATGSPNGTLVLEDASAVNGVHTMLATPDALFIGSGSGKN